MDGENESQCDQLIPWQDSNFTLQKTSLNVNMMIFQAIMYQI